jgi:hypothetical protein
MFVLLHLILLFTTSLSNAAVLYRLQIPFWVVAGIILLAPIIIVIVKASGSPAGSFFFGIISVHLAALALVGILYIIIGKSIVLVSIRKYLFTKYSLQF